MQDMFELGQGPLLIVLVIYMCNRGQDLGDLCLGLGLLCGIWFEEQFVEVWVTNVALVKGSSPVLSWLGGLLGFWSYKHFLNSISMRPCVK